MSKNTLNELINTGIPVVDDYLNLSIDEIFDFIKNKRLESQFELQFQSYLNYLSSLSNGIRTGTYYKFMSISINEDTYECALTFSHTGLYISLANMLNSLDSEELTIEELRKRIRKLKHTKSEKELEKEFPYFYKSTYLRNKKEAKDKGYFQTMLLYEKYKDDFLMLNKMRERFKEDGLDLEKEYLFAKSCFDFQTFIDCSSKYFGSIIDNYETIKKWMINNPVKLTLTKDETKKILLYIIYRQIENMSRYASSNEKLYAQKNVVAIENLIEKYKSMFPGDSTSIRFNRSPNIDKNKNSTLETYTFELNIDELIKLFNKQIKKYQFLKQNVTMPDIDKSLTFEENMIKLNVHLISLLNNTIKDDKEHGAKEVSDSEIEDKINQLESDIKSETISEKNRNIKKLILEKIKMVLIDIKPKAKQTGIGIFSNYYVYFYPNGMVAVDIIDKYGALYIMPVHIYKEARYKGTLKEVRSIPGVKYVEHKGNNWLVDAKNYILEGTNELTEKDIKDSEEVASIDFPYTIKQIQDLEIKLKEEGKLTNSIAKEAEKRKERIKKLEDINSELSTKSDEELSYDTYTSEEEETIESEKSFDELYDYWKKKHQKVKRNPIVSGVTKKRARDEEGNYCCDLCGSKNFESSSFDSHHMIPLNLGGIDNIYNTVCLCPNCHRLIHSKRVTFSQQAQLFRKIQNYIEEDYPEYLEDFKQMTSPIAKDEEYYKLHKEEIDRNFQIEWNGYNNSRQI